MPEANMILLSLDTCERRGSVAVRRNGTLAAQAVHDTEEDYSSWLLQAVEKVLKAAGLRHSDLDVYAACTGPGSFTGVRLGLCTVKAWAEVYGKPIVPVSRLEALASLAERDGLVAASYDAHRGQAFAGLYRRTDGRLAVEGAEMVAAPADFLHFVRQQAGGASFRWLSLDPAQFTELPEWALSPGTGSMEKPEWGGLANAIGALAEQRAARREFTDVLELDANYVRRSDAEIFWKGPAHRVG